MKTKTLLLLSFVLLCSCSGKFYQICSVSYDNLKRDRDYLVYQNNDCMISYRIGSSPSGNPGFHVYNKTDSTIYINLEQSFYVYNGTAHDYYEDRTFKNGYINLATGSYSISKNSSFDRYGRSYDGYPAKKGSSNTNSFLNSYTHGEYGDVSVRERPIVGIPPKSDKVFEKFTVLNSLIIYKEKKKDFPKKIYNSKDYDKISSPIFFRNRISYSFDSECKNTKSIENDFWISKFTNCSEKYIKKQKKSNTEYELFQSPDKFYKIYQRYY